MLRLVRPILFLVALVAAHKSFADDLARLQGAWKLLSYTVEYQATGGKEAVMGEKPIGYAIFTPEGRAMFVITGEGRKPETDDKGRAALLNTLIAYPGRYRIEGARCIMKVAVAWISAGVWSD